MLNEKAMGWILDVIETVEIKFLYKFSSLCRTVDCLLTLYSFAFLMYKVCKTFYRTECTILHHIL